MPSKTHTAKEKLNELLKIDPKDCDAVRHMATGEGGLFCLYDLMVGYAKAGRKSREGNDATGPLLFTASFKTTVPNALGISVNTAYRWRDRLEELGWIELVKEGEYDYDRKENAPDTWRVLEHEEFAAKHPGSCPPYTIPIDHRTNKEFRQLRSLANDETGRSARFYNWSSPLGDAISEVMATWTEEDWRSAIENWKSNPVTYESKIPVPAPRDRTVPTDRDRAVPTQTVSQSLPAEKPVPTQSESQSLRMEKPVPTRRDVSVTTSAKASVTTPHNPTTDEFVELWGVLLRRFVEVDGDEPKRTTTKEKADLRKLARVGKEKFLAAAEAWLAAHPWDSQTTNPLLGLINGFDGYLAKVEHNKKVENSRLTAADLKRTNEVANKLNNDFWAQETAPAKTDEEIEGGSMDEFFKS